MFHALYYVAVMYVSCFFFVCQELSSLIEFQWNVLRFIEHHFLFSKKVVFYALIVYYIQNASRLHFGILIKNDLIICQKFNNNESSLSM